MSATSFPTPCPRCSGPLESAGPLMGLCQRCLLSGEHRATVAEDPRTPPPGTDTLAEGLPELDILGLIGRGGMGIVYRARQRRLERLVALKVLAPELSQRDDFAERFLREARVLARLDHPNLVGVHDFGQVGELYYLVLEYVDGTSLRELISGDERLAPAEALAIVPQICEGLAYAHEMGVVHRDIKPDNVLINRAGRVKIADFGLAKMVGSDAERSALTRRSQVMGTPQYMAPEQLAASRDVDHRADIFSLGVVFYEMLTGELPVGRFEPPSHRVQVDVRLDEVVLRALEREPARRYQTASEVRTDLEGIDGEARLPGSLETSSRTTKGGRDENAPATPGFLTRIAAPPWIVVQFVVGLGLIWLVVAAMQDLGTSREWMAGAYPFAFLGVLARGLPLPKNANERLRSVVFVRIAFAVCVATVVLLSTQNFSSPLFVLMKVVAGALVVFSHLAFDRWGRRGEWGSLLVCGVLLLIAAVVHTSLYSFNHSSEVLAFSSGFLSVMTLGSALVLTCEYLAPPVPPGTPNQLARILAVGLPGVVIYFRSLFF